MGAKVRVPETGVKSASGVASSATVVYATVTVWGTATERLNVKLATVEPASPSMISRSEKSSVVGKGLRFGWTM